MSEKFLFGAVKLTKNADFDFSLSDSSGFGKNVMIFGTDMS